MAIRTVEQARAWRAKLNGVTETLPDEQAAEVADIYDAWMLDKDYPLGARARREDKLYKCLQAHTSQIGWEPENVPALWVVINETHAGTIDDPIPASRGMEYEYGKYYIDPEDGKTYLCKRGTETGTIVLQYLPHELVGHYFEVA